MKKIAAMLMVLLVIGCASAASFKPTQDQLANANFGNYPDNYEAITKAYLSIGLFDPYSAVFTFSKPVKGRMAGGPTPVGWLVCGTLNAKNRYGGYVGIRNFVVKIYDGVVVYDMSGEPARQVCEWIL